MAQCGHVQIPDDDSLIVVPPKWKKLRNMPMVNQECNYVNHFDLETKSTPSSKKFIQPYQIGLKL
jgi:hypothetical protein